MAARALIVYRLLLRAFPASFRDRFGNDMADVFADRLRAARAAGGLAVATLCTRTAADVVTHGIAERRAERARARIATYRRATMWSSIWQDLRCAVRALRRRPGFTLTVSLMLAVGLGFNIALFAVVRSVLLRPLPYQQPDRIMMLWTGRNPDGTGGVNSYADYLSWKEQNHTFESLATYNMSFGTLTDAGDPEEISGSTVSPEFFKLLGVKLTLGRGIEPGDELISPDAGRPIAIAFGLWQRRFNADPRIVGKTLTIGGRARTIVGVVAPEFVQPEPFWGELAQYWTPLTVAGDMPTAHGNHFLRVIGRLAPRRRPRAGAGGDGSDRPAADSGVSDDEQGVSRRVTAARRAHRRHASAALDVLRRAGAGALARCRQHRQSAARAREPPARGARDSRGAWRQPRPADDAVHHREHGDLASWAASWACSSRSSGIRLLLAYGSIDAPGIETTRLDATVIGFAALLSMATGALCGLLPAWRVARARFASSLIDVRGSSGLEVSRARMWLVAARWRSRCRCWSAPRCSRRRSFTNSASIRDSTRRTRCSFASR